MHITKLAALFLFGCLGAFAQCPQLVLNPVTMQLDCVNNTGALTSIATGTTSNTDLAGSITTAAGTATYTFSNTNASAPICTVANTTDSTTGYQVTTTTTTLTVTHGGSVAHTFYYICIRRT